MNVLELIGAVLLFALAGALFLAKPEWIWRIENILETKGGEPTDLYLTGVRLLGIGLVVTALVLLLIGVKGIWGGAA